MGKRGEGSELGAVPNSCKWWGWNQKSSIKKKGVVGMGAHRKKKKKRPLKESRFQAFVTKSHEANY